MIGKSINFFGKTSSFISVVFLIAAFIVSSQDAAVASTLVLGQAEGLSEE